MSSIEEDVKALKFKSDNISNNFQGASIHKLLLMEYSNGDRKKVLEDFAVFLARFNDAHVIIMVANNGDETTKASNAILTNNTNETNILDPRGPKVQFILFTRVNNPYHLMVGDYKGFENSEFNANNPTKIIIHGYLSSVNDEIFYLNKNAYLGAGDYNVIGMDWSALCKFEYFTAIKGAQLAANALTNFIEFLNRVGVQYESIHLIGHSLGAHVAGMASDVLKNGRIARITGLDPAGPGYNDVPPNLRLDAGDAVLVDAIHTYMRVLSLSQPVGHVDFYPNGGRFQPGCPEFYDIWKVPESINCNHGRAYVYFAESISNTRAFKAQRCTTVQDAVDSRCFEESDVYMGQADTYQNGLYYVKTNPAPPFSMTEHTKTTSLS